MRKQDFLILFLKRVRGGRHNDLNKMLIVLLAGFNGNNFVDNLIDHLTSFV